VLTRFQVLSVRLWQGKLLVLSQQISAAGECWEPGHKGWPRQMLQRMLCCSVLSIFALFFKIRFSLVFLVPLVSGHWY